MSLPFYVVYRMLVWLSEATGLSYEEVNIIVYYVIVPMTFLGLVDRIIRKPIFTILYIATLLVVATRIRDFHVFAEDLFDWSVDFLLGFSKVGLGYDSASVVVCLLLPLLMFLCLFSFAFPASFKWAFPTLNGILADGRVRGKVSKKERSGLG